MSQAQKNGEVESPENDDTGKLATTTTAGSLETTLGSTTAATPAPSSAPSTAAPSDSPVSTPAATLPTTPTINGVRL